MKKSLLTLLLSALLLLSACGGAPAGTPGQEEDVVHILATTYPVYLLTTAVTGGLEDIQVDLLVKDQISCLHDYTLTVNDMKAIESADIIVMNGVGLEDFMSDALSKSSATVIDCSQGIDLLPYEGHEDHDEDHGETGHWDPHIWMDPNNARQMGENIQAGLSAADPDHKDAFDANATQAWADLGAAYEQWSVTLNEGGDGYDWRKLITFHDGFGYFAHAYGFTILKAIEEEEGSEASAADIKEIVTLIEEEHLPAIFTEVNGSTSTAEAIQRETGVGVSSLNMIMSGQGSGIQPYLDAMEDNIQTLIHALGNSEVTVP